MKVSLNWLQKFHDLDIPIDKLVDKIGAQLGAVEQVVDLSKKYEGIIVARVVECAKHPDAGKLSICLINDGVAVAKIRRDPEGLVQVVCGAPNVRAGQLVAWIPPGVSVPSTLDKDPLKLESRKIRGQLSNGMLASARELDLGNDHEGILVIDEEAEPGTPFVELYHLNDHIIDIENKMFTHRPDLFGILGVAREIAGINHQSFESPHWYRQDAELESPNEAQLVVKNELPELVPRFTAAVISDVRVKPSPVWLQTYLSRVGIKPVNNIVDITNYVMHETAQPLHAYDYDKVKTGTLGVRFSKSGEQLELLGGKKIKLKKGAIVITDGHKPIGLGGIMGGAGTEVSSSTRNIILEAATFDMNLTRKSAREYGLFTDAAMRFTKNQSPRQNMAVLAYAAQTVDQLAGGEVSARADEGRRRDKLAPVKTTADFVNKRLGLELGGVQMKQLLENVEFQVEERAGHLSVHPPFWRMDIHIPEDIVEEVGRLHGYDHLPLVLPTRSIEPAATNSMLKFKDWLRSLMIKAGANEVLTYSFVHESLLRLAAQDPVKAYHIRNAQSPDLQYYRQSLTPSLLEKVHPNVKAGFDEFMLIELGRAHVRGVQDAEKLPAELERLAMVVTAAKDRASGAPYYMAKKITDYLAAELGLSDLRFEELSKVKTLPAQWAATAGAYEPGRSAVVHSGNALLGLVGEPSLKLRSALKLPAVLAQAEFDIESLQQLKPSGPPYRPLNKFPGIEQDICLRTKNSINYAEIQEFVAGQLNKLGSTNGLNVDSRPIDIFIRDNDRQYRQTTFRISFEHPARTLTTEEVNKLLDELAAEAKTKLKAERG